MTVLVSLRHESLGTMINYLLIQLPIFLDRWPGGESFELAYSLHPLHPTFILALLQAWLKHPNVSVKSKLQDPPPGQAPRHLTCLKTIVQIPPYPGQNDVQMPHTRVHSRDQMPPPQGHFTGTKLTEGRRKRLQLSNKIFINTANNSHSKTEKHC